MSAKLEKKKSEKPVSLAAPFRNKLQLFPEEIRDKLDELIHLGRGAQTGLKYVKATYRGALEIPSIGTFETYFKWRKEYLLAAPDAELQIQKVMAKKMDLTGIPVSDKRAMLDAVVGFMAWRIEEVKVVNAHLHSPQYERIITDDTRVILDTIATQLKLEDKAAITKEKVRAVVQAILRHMGAKVQEAYVAVNGKKALQGFLETLDRMNEDLPYETMTEEAIKAYDSEDGGE